MACLLARVVFFTMLAGSYAIPPLCVGAVDGSITVCIGPDGTVSSISPLSASYDVNASTLLEDSVTDGPAVVSQAYSGGPITVVQSWRFANETRGGALVTDVYSAGSSTILWNVTVAGTSAAPWSVAIDTKVTFSPSAYEALKLWSAWDRGSSADFPKSWIDPLQPSDQLPSGWWDGMYLLGSARANRAKVPCDASDYISVPLATVVASDPASSVVGDSGFTVLLSPEDPPYDTCFLVQGSQLAYTFQRFHHRIWASGPPVLLHLQIAGHAADWRGGLGAAVDAFPEHFEPVNEEVFSCCAGTGSYSYYIGPLNESALEAVDYAVNWDLSGRFFPYMGMFLPPVPEGGVWLNDPEGTQPRANVTCASIGSWYRAMLTAGFTDLSYFNINEYGLNIVVPEPASAPAYDSSTAAGTCADTWQNASACLAEAFADALLTRSFSAVSGALVQSAIYSWQNAVVMDPGVPSYHSFLLEQLERHITCEDGFAGIVIDRSDWQDLYNLARDDGTSFLPEVIGAGFSGTAASLKLSYLAMTADLRAALSVSTATRQQAAAISTSPVPAGSGIMMMNTVGNARLDQLRWYDGTFSEGSAVNGVGILGAASPAILWTYNEGECCSSPEQAALFFQAQLYMGVCPMAPFPGNDHSIDPSPVAQTYYASYGPLFRAVASKVWVLAPHIVGVVNSTANGSSFAKVNAFAVPDTNGTDVDLVIPVVMGQAGGSVYLNVTGADRVWAPVARRRGRCSIHPAVHADCNHAGGAGGLLNSAVEYEYSVQWPGGSGTWEPLYSTTQPSAVVNVTLHVEGAAVVRIQRKASMSADF